MCVWRVRGERIEGDRAPGFVDFLFLIYIIQLIYYRINYQSYYFTYIVQYFECSASFGEYFLKPLTLTIFWTC